MNGAKYHYMLASEHGRKAADLLNEAEDHLHAARALCELSVADEDEAMPPQHLLPAKVERLRERAAALWSDVSDIGYM